jgi:hypothetical protein
MSAEVTRYGNTGWEGSSRWQGAKHPVRYMRQLAVGWAAHYPHPVTLAAPHLLPGLAELVHPLAEVVIVLAVHLADRLQARNAADAVAVHRPTPLHLLPQRRRLQWGIGSAARGSARAMAVQIV